MLDVWRIPKDHTRGAVRRLLLDAATLLFAKRAYARTHTRAIAERACVANLLLHQHFSSKVQLSEEAVFDPLVLSSSRCSWAGNSAPRSRGASRRNARTSLGTY